ncbi:MAG: NAD(P)/FAD-dependent oxidoreductase [Lachnospiraceae bacterium]|nr:NAD(P)/FAD-dependent oxidoreductase [Lachnospiraceae bacterium]
MKVVIIGGGASGLMAGIQAARAGASVTILEKCDKPGKKILATGNGRCNLTNQKQELSAYHGDQKFVQSVLSSFSMKDTLDFFHELGLWTKERDGWIYPRSDSAASVLQLLLLEFTRLKGKLKTREEVTAIRLNRGIVSRKANIREEAGVPLLNEPSAKQRPAEERFTVFTKSWQYDADAVIVACGTPASNIEGVSSDALTLAKSFGLKTKEFRPSLVSLKCTREHYFAKWAGVRVQAVLDLICDGAVLQTETGELQLTDYGISGIPVFQLSSKAGELLEQGRKPSVRINFLPEFSQTEAESAGCASGSIDSAFDESAQNRIPLEAQKRIPLEASLSKVAEQNPGKTPEQLLTGLLPEKLIDALSGKKMTLEQLLDRLSCCDVRIASTGPLRQAQICAGGVLLTELTHELEAKNISGLYFTGECTDLDGRCGGYNLQWAWSTGAAAGRAAAVHGSNK